MKNERYDVVKEIIGIAGKDGTVKTNIPADVVVSCDCREFKDPENLEKNDCDLFYNERVQAQKILLKMDKFQTMTRTEKKEFKNHLYLLGRDTVGFVIDGIPLKGYDEFRDFVISIFTDCLCSNDKLARLMRESLMYKSENLKRRNNREVVDLDTFNAGKHCDKYSKRPSHQNKAKGKAYARVRVTKINLN